MLPLFKPVVSPASIYSCLCGLRLESDPYTRQLGWEAIAAARAGKEMEKRKDWYLHDDRFEDKPAPPIPQQKNWEYRDDLDNVYGPFSASTIIKWLAEGYYDKELTIRRIGSYWTKLGLALEELKRESDAAAKGPAPSKPVASSIEPAVGNLGRKPRTERELHSHTATVAAPGGHFGEPLRKREQVQAVAPTFPNYPPTMEPDYGGFGEGDYGNGSRGKRASEGPRSDLVKPVALQPEYGGPRGASGPAEYGAPRTLGAGEYGATRGALGAGEYGAPRRREAPEGRGRGRGGWRDGRADVGRGRSGRANDAGPSGWSQRSQGPVPEQRPSPAPKSLADGTAIKRPISAFASALPGSSGKSSKSGDDAAEGRASDSGPDPISPPRSVPPPDASGIKLQLDEVGGTLAIKLNLVLPDLDATSLPISDELASSAALAGGLADLHTWASLVSQASASVASPAPTLSKQSFSASEPTLVSSKTPAAADSPEAGTAETEAAPEPLVRATESGLDHEASSSDAQGAVTDPLEKQDEAASQTLWNTALPSAHVAPGADAW